MFAQAAVSDLGQAPGQRGARAVGGDRHGRAAAGDLRPRPVRPGGAPPRRRSAPTSARPTGSPPPPASPTPRSPSAGCSRTRFAGIAPSSAPVFIAAQVGGGIAGVLHHQVPVPGAHARPRRPGRHAARGGTDTAAGRGPRPRADAEHRSQSRKVTGHAHSRRRGKRRGHQRRAARPRGRPGRGGHRGGRRRLPELLHLRHPLLRLRRGHPLAQPRPPHPRRPGSGRDDAAAGHHRPQDRRAPAASCS